MEGFTSLSFLERLSNWRSTFCSNDCSALYACCVIIMDAISVKKVRTLMTVLIIIDFLLIYVSLYCGFLKIFQSFSLPDGLSLAYSPLSIIALAILSKL